MTQAMWVEAMTLVTMERAVANMESSTAIKRGLGIKVFQEMRRQQRARALEFRSTSPQHSSCYFAVQRKMHATAGAKQEQA